MTANRPIDVAGAEHLLEGFMANRKARTLQAYWADLNDFAGFVGQAPAQAIAQLLGGGGEAAARRVLEFAVDRRSQGFAAATVQRRLATLRALTRFALNQSVLEWSLEPPDNEQLEEAVRARSASTVPYLFPRHPGEIDRLDVQHYALRETLGVNHLAPIEPPRHALDVGCGTGQWAFELCHRYPDAMVVGLDLVPSKPGWPPGYRYVRANLLDGLPFAANLFDFVYQRLLVVALPVDAWPAAVAELVRVTRPGGWVELLEPIFGVQDAGPAVEQFNRLAYGIAAARGLDVGRVVYDSLDGYLRAAGLEDVVRQEVSLPIGDWGGRVGTFLATDMRVTQAQFSAVLQTQAGISEEECRTLVQRAQEECEQRRMSCSFAIAYGRKPD